VVARIDDIETAASGSSTELPSRPQACVDVAGAVVRFFGLGPMQKC
jgi:hypothetical protein